MLKISHIFLLFSKCKFLPPLIFSNPLSRPVKVPTPVPAHLPSGVAVPVEEGKLLIYAPNFFKAAHPAKDKHTLWHVRLLLHLVQPKMGQ